MTEAGNPTRNVPQIETVRSCLMLLAHKKERHHGRISFYKDFFFRVFAAFKARLRLSALESFGTDGGRWGCSALGVGGG